jgi:hypothetical protein
MIATARLIDFRRDGAWYRFIWRADGEDFARAPAALKTMRSADRRFDPESKVWSLRVGPGTDRLLIETFANGGQVVGTVKAQLRLF